MGAKAKKQGRADKQEKTTALVKVGPLAKLEGATRMLAEAKSLDEVKAVVDLAEAAKTYARAAKLGHEAQNHAAEIALSGKRKAGAILAQLEKSSGGRPPKTAHAESVVSEYRRTIDEANIEEREAQRWQRIAAVHDDVFATYVSNRKTGGDEITEAGLLRVAKKYEEAVEPVKPTEFEDVDTGFISAGERGKCEVLSRGLESEVQAALERYLKLGMDQRVAAEVLRRIADKLPSAPAIIEAEEEPVVEAERAA